MMRYLKILFLSMMVIGLFAVTAMAVSTITDNANTGIGWEATNLTGCTTVPFDGRFISYTPDINLGFAQNETITFTLSNGTFQDNVLYVLCGSPISAVTNPADLKIADQIAGGFGTNFITFRFNESTVVGANVTTPDAHMDISRDGSLCGQLATTGYSNLSIRSNPGLGVGAVVSVAVTDARTVGNAQITTALATGANAGTIMDVRRQYGVSYLPDGTTSVPRMISIAADLKLFTEAPEDLSLSYYTFTGLYECDSSWLPSNNNNQNWHGCNIRGTDDTAGARLTLTGIPAAANQVFYDVYGCEKVATNWVCDIPEGTAVRDILTTARCNTSDRVIYIYVDTVTPIDNAVINASLNVNFDNSNFLDQTYSFTNAVWQREGTTLHVPLVKSLLPTFETYIKLQTKSSIPNPPVLAAVLCGDGSVQTGNFGPIVAGTPLLITGAELIGVCTNSGRSVDGNAGFAATLTINSKETDMFGYANTCYQGDVGCRRIPVKTQRGSFDIQQSGIVSE